MEVPVDPPASFSASGEATRPDRWWTAFDSPELDRAVADALADNLDLEAAWHRLRAAEAVALREASDLEPDVDAVAELVERSPDAAGSEPLWLGMTAAYEVDLWGRIRARVAAEERRADASLEDYRAAALSLSAEVVRTSFRLAEARRQVELLQRQIEADEAVEELLENRFGSGLVRSVDVLRQRQLTEATRELLLAARARVATLEHLLAILLGRSPIEGELPGAAVLPELPPLPTTGVPSELLRRRPDLRRAFRLVQAADRELAAAIAARYPRVNLSASLATSGEASDLFSDWARTLVADLLGPLFRGGELAAEVDRAEAVRAARVAEYGAVSLQALREVEDALAREERQTGRVTSLEEQIRLAELTYEQLRLEFFNGLSDYIDVLTALTELQRLERDLVTARRVLLEERVALYRALAGGFGTDREVGDRDGA